MPNTNENKIVPHWKCETKFHLSDKQDVRCSWSAWAHYITLPCMIIPKWTVTRHWSCFRYISMHIAGPQIVRRDLSVEEGENYTLMPDKLELHLHHFCQQVPAFVNDSSVKGIKIAFHPFLPITMPERKQVFLHLHFYKDLKGNKKVNIITTLLKPTINRFVQVFKNFLTFDPHNRWCFFWTFFLLARPFFDAMIASPFYRSPKRYRINQELDVSIILRYNWFIVSVSGLLLSCCLLQCWCFHLFFRYVIQNNLSHLIKWKNT